MSGSKRDGDNLLKHQWLQGLVVIVIIILALGLFSPHATLERPTLGALNILGIVIMFAGLALVMFASPLAERFFENRREAAGWVLKLIGALICGAGAILVFL